MSKKSAGIICYRFNSNNELQVLLVHPGGPFFQNKDAGVWSVPKGEYSDEEDPHKSAIREFYEETGNRISGHDFITLEPVKIKSGKIIQTWAIEEDFEPAYISSNTFEVEWPPRTGIVKSYPEADKAEWFLTEDAKIKIHPGQLAIILQLEALLL